MRKADSTEARLRLTKNRWMLFAMGILILGACVAAVSLIPGIRKVEFKLLELVSQGQLDETVWMARLLKASVLVLAACALGLCALVVWRRVPADVRAHAGTSYARIPAWAKHLTLMVVGILLYCTRGVNILPFMVILMLYREGVWESLRHYWGERPLRVAATLGIIVAFVYTLIMLFFRMENVMDLFWGDSTRVVEDFTAIDASHYRVKTHPLYVLMCQTVYHLIAPAVGASARGFALRMMIIVAASVNVGLFSLFVSRICRSRFAPIGLSVLFACSYPMVYHGAMMVESFIFSQTTVLACMLYFQRAYERRVYSFWPLMALAVATAGINLGYVAIFGVMYLVLLRVCDMGWARVLKSIFLFALAFFILMNVFMLIQYLFYGQGAAATSMPMTLLQALRSTAEEDVNYLNSSLTVGFIIEEHLPRYFSTVLFWRPLNYMSDVRMWWEPLWWEPLWAIVLLVPYLRIRHVRQRSMLTALTLSNIFLMLLHSVYGSDEAPLYGPVIGVALLALLPFVFDSIEEVRVGRLLTGAVISVLVATELALNVPGMVCTHRINRLIFPSDVTYTQDEIAKMLLEFDRLGGNMPSIWYAAQKK